MGCVKAGPTGHALLEHLDEPRDAGGPEREHFAPKSRVEGLTRSS